MLSNRALRPSLIVSTRSGEFCLLVWVETLSFASTVTASAFGGTSSTWRPIIRQGNVIFLPENSFLVVDWPPGTQPSTPTATAAVRASFFPTFCGFFAHDSFFPSFHVGSTPWTRTSTIARLCLSSAAPDPSTDGHLGPWEFSRLLPRPVGMWLGQTYMLKVCLPGHEGSISCPYVMYCSVLAHGFRH